MKKSLLDYLTGVMSGIGIISLIEIITMPEQTRSAIIILCVIIVAGIIMGLELSNLLSEKEN